MNTGDDVSPSQYEIYHMTSISMLWGQFNIQYWWCCDTIIINVVNPSQHNKWWCCYSQSTYDISHNWRHNQCCVSESTWNLETVCLWFVGYFGLNVLSILVLIRIRIGIETRLWQNHEHAILCLVWISDWWCNCIGRLFFIGIQEYLWYFYPGNWKPF